MRVMRRRRRSTSGGRLFTARKCSGQALSRCKDPCRPRLRPASSAASTTASGIAKPPGLPSVVVAKTVPRTRPSASTRGPPELPLRTLPRRRADRAPDRAVPVGVLADHVAGFAEAGRGRRVGAVFGVAEDGARLAAARRSGPATAAGSRRVDAQDREVVGGVVVDGGRVVARRRRSVVTVVSSSPATTWALVTTRPGAATQPEPSTPSPQAVPRTRTTERPARQTSGSVAIPRVGRRDRGGRADDRGRRVDAVEGVEHRARGRQQLVEAAQDQRALDVAAQVGGAGSVQGDGAEDPDDARGRRRRPARRRRRRRRGAGAGGRGSPSPRSPSAMLSRVDRDQRPDDQRARAPRAAARRATRAPCAAPAAPACCRRRPRARTRAGSARRRSSPCR